MQCELCKFYSMGNCRRFPAARPVAEDYWCGEYKAKGKLKQPDMFQEPKKRTKLPSDWELSKEDGCWALQEKGLTEEQILHQAETFKVHHNAEGTLMFDWSAAWKKWINNYIDWNKK